MQLFPDDHALLGLIALNGPQTAYDLKRGIAHLAEEFWSVPHTNVYERAAALARAGLLSADQEQRGRRRRVYSLTETGAGAFEAWLTDTRAGSMEIRDESQLKLLFTELSSRDAVTALARRQVEAYEERLQRLEEVERRFSDDERRLRMLSVPLGRAVYTAARDFWARIAEDPPEIEGESSSQTAH